MATFKKAISNIAWDKADDAPVYAAMKEYGFTGLELAPTRIFPEEPYSQLSSAALFGGYLRQAHGFSVPSIQSIWYGRTESIFDPAGAEALLAYTAEAFDFAHALGCPSLVFGCPKNRTLPADAGERERRAGDDFFERAGHLAAQRGVRLAIEANAPCYTNYLTHTADAFALVKRLDNPGLAVNLDLSTVITNGENLQDFVHALPYVSHLHISEPALAPIQPRPLHRELALLLGAVGYSGYLSVEMRRTDLETIRRTLDYISEVFG
ncbi:MAG: sugar phosphate isomerase/epimerase [Gemmiger sp.]|nr:sugar phosphate isomerase/epimerase [Gemmiger sp.]